MDDEQYLQELMTQVSARKIRSLDDVADDVRTNLNKTVEGIIGAGKALQKGRDMLPSDKAFGGWCMQEFPELGSRTRSNMMAIARRFGQHLNAHQLRYSVLAELAAPSVSDDVVEQVIAAPTPMKLAEVKELKKGWNNDNSDTSKAKAPLHLVASSLFGVLTNVQMFEDTNDTVVDPNELERAIRAEMHIYGERSHDEIKQQVEGLKRVADLLEQSLEPIVAQRSGATIDQTKADLPPDTGGVGSGTSGTPNTEPLLHDVTMIASCFIGVRTNLMMHKDVNSVDGVSDYDLARAISFEVHKHYPDDDEMEAVLLELKDLAIQLSKAMEITISETNHNVVAINPK